MFWCMVAGTLACTLRAKRQVGQLVSCSSQDCRQELKGGERRINTIVLGLAGVSSYTYLWNKWPQGSFLAVSIFSQQMAQLSEFSCRSAWLASG